MITKEQMAQEQDEAVHYSNPHLVSAAKLRWEVLDYTVRHACAWTAVQPSYGEMPEGVILQAVWRRPGLQRASVPACQFTSTLAQGDATVGAQVHPD